MTAYLIKQSNNEHYKNYFLLFVICLLAYWPLTFGIFSVKNDAIHYFLPNRFNISEALRNGELPLWSPYIYLGYPIHGDMQSGAWNPIVWLFSIIGRYDLTLFHFEHLLYIFLGGAGIYKLTNRLYQHPQTSLLVAASYMLSGFMLGGQLINWLASAAFFPFVIHYFLQSCSSPSWKNPAQTGVALYLMLTAGYPSFFIITCYILILLLIIRCFELVRQGDGKDMNWKKIFLNQLLIVVVFITLSLPAIISFLDLLPYYQRGGGTTYAEVLMNSFEWQHFISFFFPSSIGANNISSGTDVTMRNMYIGILPLIAMIAFPPTLNRKNLLLISLALFSILFAAGDTTPLRKLCYKIVPLMDTFRHPAQMRLFTIFSIVLLVAPGIKKLLEKESSAISIKKINSIMLIAGGIIAIASLISFFQSGILKNFSDLVNIGIKQSLKNLLSSVTLSDAILVNSLLQLGFIILLLFSIKRKKKKSLNISLIHIINLIVMAQFVLPLTLVSKTSSSEINNLIHSSPKGFPTTNLEKPITQNSADATLYLDKIGISYFYNKKIGISTITNNPSFLQQQDSFIQNRLLYNYVATRPVVYIANKKINIADTSYIADSCDVAFGNFLSTYTDTSSCLNRTSPIVENLSSNSFQVKLTTIKDAMLVLSQNYHHRWKAYVDDKPTKIEKVNMSFIGVDVPAGEHMVEFVFKNTTVSIALWGQAATLLLLIIFASLSLPKNKK
jgi:hypothetical protein